MINNWFIMVVFHQKNIIITPNIIKIKKILTFVLFYDKKGV